MSAPELHWQSFAVSNVGCVRKINEDACLDSASIGLWVVADGMGGHAAGDFASRSIVEALSDLDEPESLSQFVDEVEARVLSVNQLLRDEAARRGGSQMIGSTIIALLAWRRHAVCLWAGDSRLYRCRDGVVTQMMRDHSQVEEMIESGLLLPEDAENHPAANVITRAVGAGDELFIDVDLFELQDGDQYMLCSDGLYKEVRDAELAGFLQGKDTQQAASALVDAAVARGARDNVTVIVVQVMAHV